MAAEVCCAKMPKSLEISSSFTPRASMTKKPKAPVSSFCAFKGAIKKPCSRWTAPVSAERCAASRSRGRTPSSNCSRVISYGPMPR